MMQIPRPARFLGPTWILPALALAFFAGAPAEAQESSLDELEGLLDTRISSASRYLQDTKEAAASVTVISSEDIERFGYLTLYDALTTVRGFYGTQDRNYSYIGVRGFSRPTDYNNRILLMLNGHVLNENNFSGAFPGLGFGVDMESVERIEVVRGPSSAVYGSSAMLAVVNVVTKEVGPDRRAVLTGETGSAGYRRAGISYSEVLGGLTELRLSGHWFDSNGGDLYFPEFDDQSSNNGLAAGLDWEQGYGFVGSLRGGNLTLDVSAASRTKGIPTAPWESLFNDDRAQTRDARLSTELRYERAVADNTTLQLAGSYDTYDYQGSYPYALGDGGLFEDFNEGRWLGVKSQLTWDPTPASRVVFGADGSFSRKASYGASDEENGELAGYDRPFDLLSAFAQGEFSLSPRASVTLGTRLDSYSDFGAYLSRRAALIVHPWETTTLKLLYGEAFRAPSRWEAYYEEEDYFKRNPSLDPERISTSEIVMEQQLTPRLLGTLSLYDYRMTDIIEEGVDPADDLGVYENASSVDARGLEVALRGSFSARSGGYLGYTYQRALDEEDAGVTNSPRHQLRGGVHVPLRQVGTAAAEVVHDGGRATVWETSTDPYTLVNLTLSTRELGQGARATLAVRNVFDTQYDLPGGWEHAQYGIPQAGRTLRLTANVPF